MPATMTRYAGSTGEVTIAGNVILAINDWGFDAKGESVDVTGMGDTFTKRRPVGIADGSFTATAVFDSAAAPPPPAYPPVPSHHTALGLSLAFKFKGTATGNPTIEGSGVLNSMSLKSAIRGRVEYSISGDTDGEYTILP